ncbi:MAG: ShlB/FhaC/HecB family hemolysin secretion/activation protein [Ramlibacter sp.]|nr:ShlB/FhaC/HecB family hemolysin secretion/activation protein [Ramlibacter sp.]
MGSVLAGLAGPALAQPQPADLTPDAAIQEGLRRQEERSRQQQEQLQPRSNTLRPAPAALPEGQLPEETPCFVVQEVRLEGTDWQRFSWLQEAALPYLRHCVGVQGLSRIAAGLDKRLLDLGFATTRVSLPAQNLQSGVLRIQLHVGRVADIRLVEPEPRWGTWRNAFPVSRGDVLNVRDLEQGVEQMKRLPSQTVATKLEPGVEPDTTVVVIERRAGALRDRVRGGITLDNSGSPSLGRTQFSGNLALDNPLGLNDLVSLSLSSNLEKPDPSHRSQSLGLNYSLPWGYNTFSLSASQSRFAQYVQGTTVRFLSSGRSENTELRLQRTVLRTGSAKLSLYGSLSLRRAESFLDDVELLVQRRRTTNVETGLNYRHLFAQSSLDLDLGYRRGMPWQHAQDDLLTASQGGATLRPRIWTFGASYATAFRVGAESAAPRQVQFTSSLRGQHTRDTTLSIDQMAIGGRSSVRGFDGDAVLIAESGVIWRNEVSTPFALAPGVDATGYLGLDWGRVWGPSDVALVGKKLAGVAFGLRGRQAALQYDICLAAPLYRPDGFRTRPWNLYATVTYPF